MQCDCCCKQFHISFCCRQSNPAHICSCPPSSAVSKMVKPNSNLELCLLPHSSGQLIDTVFHTVLDNGYNPQKCLMTDVQVAPKLRVLEPKRICHPLPHPPPLDFTTIDSVQRNGLQPQLMQSLLSELSKSLLPCMSTSTAATKSSPISISAASCKR